MKKLTVILLALAMLATMTACGSKAAASSAEGSSSETSEVNSSAEGSAEDSAEEASVEESAEEVYEPTVDDLFSDLIDSSNGVYVKLQFYNRKGTPIRNASVTISSESGEMTTETDFSGYALLSELALDTEYTVSITDGDEEEPAPYGSFTLTITSGEGYAEGGEEEGNVVVTVADEEDSCVDMAVTGTDDDGSVCTFNLSRVSEWAGIPED